MMHSKTCRKPGVPERLPLDRVPELERQAISDYLDFAVLLVLATIEDVAMAATDTPT